MARIRIASDHAGLELKEKVTKELIETGHSVENLGPNSAERVDYPDYADRVCENLDSETVGILVCGSGQGMAMRANKYPYIRAALCWNEEMAKLAREHNDGNVLCLGSRVTDPSLISNIIVTFLNTPFAGGRHRQRVEKLNKNLTL